MADTAIFKLNTTDYSAHVVAESYAINYEDVYQEWTDGGQVKHRDVIGRKLRGTMQMYFKSQSDLQTLVPYNIALYSIGHYFHHQSHPQVGVVFALATSLHSF